MKVLDGQVIVVTGGTGVFGKAFIQALAENGAVVGILGRNRAVAEERAAQLKQQGYEAMALMADVMNEGQLEIARSFMLERYGKITGLVNAAGGNMPQGVVPPGTDLFKLDMEGLKAVLELNLFGTLLPTQVFGAAIQQHGRGSIVNISSMSAARAITRVLGYSIGKAAVEIYTKWFAVELSKRFGDKIRMNAIAPGFFLTEQNRSLLTHEDGSFTDRARLILQNSPMGRLGEAEELTGALVWLMSDSASFVTGTVTSIDGGFLAYSGV